MAIVLVGCIGGLFATGLPKGTNISFDPVVSDVLGTGKRANLIAHSLLNLIAGGMAAFILWAGYSSGVNFESTKISPVSLGAALSTGVGGISVVRNLIAKAQTSDQWENTAKESASVVKLDESAKESALVAHNEVSQEVQKENGP